MSTSITLAEALTQRADIKRAMADLMMRMESSSQHVQGEEEDIPEDANALLVHLRRLGHDLARLTASINHTNAVTALAEGMTLTTALALRDGYDQDIKTLRRAIEATKGDRYSGRRTSREELRWVSVFNVAHLRAEVDRVARARRELDTTIQKVNWFVNLEPADAMVFVVGADSDASGV